MSLDTQPQHSDTIAAWHRRYGRDMPDGSLIRWVQNGWRWCARRHDGAWTIVVHNEGARGTTTRPHTWDMLCSRLSRMDAAVPIDRYRPGKWGPSLARLPEPVGVAPADNPAGPYIPADRFPNIGATS